jgi:hypothetical protein
MGGCTHVSDGGTPRDAGRTIPWPSRATTLSTCWYSPWIAAATRRCAYLEGDVHFLILSSSSSSSKITTNKQTTSRRFDSNQHKAELSHPAGAVALQKNGNGMPRPAIARPRGGPNDDSQASKDSRKPGSRDQRSEQARMERDVDPFLAIVPDAHTHDQRESRMHNDHSGRSAHVEEYNLLSLKICERRTSFHVGRTSLPSQVLSMALIVNPRPSSARGGQIAQKANSA